MVRDLRSERQQDKNGGAKRESDMCLIDDPNLKLWSQTKEKLSTYSNSGFAGGSLWQSCLTTSPTEPSSLVRESGIDLATGETHVMWMHQIPCCKQ